MPLDWNNPRDRRTLWLAALALNLAGVVLILYAQRMGWVG